MKKAHTKLLELTNSHYSFFNQNKLLLASIASYRGYKAESKKEDDRAVRNWIMESINGLRNHAVNLMETGYRNDDDNLEREAKVMIDNIDLFKNEVNLATTGEVQSIWNKKSSPDFDNRLKK